MATPDYILQNLAAVRIAKFGIETRQPIHDTGEYLATRIEARTPIWNTYKSTKQSEVNTFNSGIDTEVSRFTGQIDSEVSQFTRQVDSEVSAFVTTSQNTLASMDAPLAGHFVPY